MIFNWPGIRIIHMFSPLSNQREARMNTRVYSYVRDCSFALFCTHDSGRKTKFAILWNIFPFSFIENSGQTKIDISTSCNNHHIWSVNVNVCRLSYANPLPAKNIWNIPAIYTASPVTKTGMFANPLRWVKHKNTWTQRTHPGLKTFNYYLQPQSVSQLCCLCLLYNGSSGFRASAQTGIQTFAPFKKTDSSGHSKRVKEGLGEGF